MEHLPSKHKALSLTCIMGKGVTLKKLFKCGKLIFARLNMNTLNLAIKHNELEISIKSLPSELMESHEKGGKKTVESQNG